MDDPEFIGASPPCRPFCSLFDNSLSNTNKNHHHNKRLSISCLVLFDQLEEDLQKIKPGITNQNARLYHFLFIFPPPPARGPKFLKNGNL
jgi:hypothetical protein